MRKILIASHGELAQGMKQTVLFFAGEQVDVSAISAYVDEETLQSKLDSFFTQVKEDDEVLIFTDLLGGSVNQVMLPYVKGNHVHVIAGVFLGIILELIFKEELYLSDETIQTALLHSKESIVYMNTYVMNLDDVEE